MTISMKVEKAFDKFQHLFIIDYLLKKKKKKPIANIFSDEKL